MLIIKSPLTLQSISAFGLYSDTLGEKIRGNYQCFGAELAGEDLLHMTMQEPEIYVGIENNGPFLMSANIHADNQIKLELVNQLINRLMLYNTQEFTYQDEVFVAAVLQKLGITDVKAFMQQIRLHMEKNELTVSLLDRYFEDGRVAARTVNQFLESNLYEKQELEIIRNEYHAERYLHNEVFRRLMTAECNNAVYTYQNPVQTRESVTKSFHDMEWIAQADSIHLAQFRENIYYQENPLVFLEYSGYEAAALAVDELTQQKVMARMGAAILVNMADKINYELQYMQGGAKQWRNYSSLFFHSAEDVLARFRYFQNNNTVSMTQAAQYEKYMSGLVRDELCLVQLMQLAERYDSGGEEDAVLYDLQRNIVISVFENQRLQRQITEQFLQNIRMAQWAYDDAGQETADIKQHRYYLEELEVYREEQKRFEEARRLLRQKRDEMYLSEKGETYHFVTAKDFWEEGQYQDMEMPVPDVEKILSERTLPPEIFKKVIDRELQDIETSVRTQTADTESENNVFEIIRSFAKPGADFDVPLMENIELLEQINSHNVYMQQLLDSKEKVHETPKRIVVDRVQARAAALRALDNPEQALLEINENGTAIESAISGEIERILSITDESTRHFYERLLGIDSADTGGADRHTKRETDSIMTAKEPDGGTPHLQHRAVQDMVSQIEENIQSIENREPQKFYGQDLIPEETADESAQKTLRTRTKEREHMRQFSEKVYSLLYQIETKEHEYRTSVQSAPVLSQETEGTQETVTRRELLHHRSADINIEDMMTLEHMRTSSLDHIMTEQAVEHSVQLVHTTKEQMKQELVEEVIASLEDSGVFRTKVSEKKEETLFTQKELQNIRNEIITQSEEHITSLVERSMKTQMHEISDMVYLELERRLKNEQRRRGY